MRISSVRRRLGLSLVECVVVCFVFGLFSTMVGHAVVVAYRSNQLTQDKTVARREVQMLLDRFRRLLKVRASGYPVDKPGDFAFVPSQAEPFEVRHLVEKKNPLPGEEPFEEVIDKYYYDEQGQAIWHVVEYPGKPAMPARKVANKVKRFWMGFVKANETLSVEIQTSTLTEPIRSTYHTYMGSAL